jgi:hypothetical protein
MQVSLGRWFDSGSKEFFFWLEHKCMVIEYNVSYLVLDILPSIAQLVERKDCSWNKMQVSLGRRFDSGSKEYFSLLSQLL